MVVAWRHTDNKNQREALTLYLLNWGEGALLPWDCSSKVTVEKLREVQCNEDEEIVATPITGARIFLKRNLQLKGSASSPVLGVLAE